MRFQLLDILPNIRNPVTGRLVSTADRLDQAVTSARQAERLGFDAVALGERHAGQFLSAGVTVVLGAIAAATSRVRVQTGVCVLSILDPLRVAEDYATIDQLSRGRVELVIGKGNELRQLPMFGVEAGQQWDQLAEKYELLRRLWREEDVSWAGKFRAPLEAVTSLPRPYAGAPRVWHGSATTLTSAALAARWGDPLFSANAIQPRANTRCSSTTTGPSTRGTGTIPATPTSGPGPASSSWPTPPRRPGSATGRCTSRWWRSSTGRATTPRATR
jgi:alkanesulfonate monooxygenase SsuD/methylene tetrahydromethanopterin reductase-like flavin-dependent oxidoreductase (luciferase family)